MEWGKKLDLDQMHLNQLDQRRLGEMRVIPLLSTLVVLRPPAFAGETTRSTSGSGEAEETARSTGSRSTTSDAAGSIGAA